MRGIAIGIIILVFSLKSTAQIVSAELQAAGLTCAMCSNAVQKSLQSLPFIGDVDPDLKHAAFMLQFKPDQSVNLDLIRKKVEDAGFSIAQLKLNVRFLNQEIKQGAPVVVGQLSFCFIGTKTQVFDGVQQLLLIDKHFTTGKKYKQYHQRIHSSACPQAIDGMPILYHVMIAE